ncbi:PqqA peptide cyclase [Streptomyces avidinii]
MNRPLPTLKYLTIKPNIHCTSDCPYCSSRQMLFQASKDVRLGVDDWARVIGEADGLGASYLDISGGEPTIYAGLAAVVWEAKRLGWFVSINTTGFQLEQQTDELASAGLDQACISIMSLDPETHNKLRTSRDGWQRMFAGIRAVAESPLRLVLHFILSRQNFRELPDVISFAFENGANSLAFVYPENDHIDRSLLMTRDDISEFQEKVLPEATKRYRELGLFDEEFPVMFPDDLVGADYALGKYWASVEEAHARCDKPDTFLLVYPNGSVLPCNGIEYAHEPIIGNVLRQSLREVWSGESMEGFRDGRIPYCEHCPIKRHCSVSVATTNNPPYYADVVKRVPGLLAPARPAVRRGTGERLSLPIVTRNQA